MVYPNKHESEPTKPDAIPSIGELFPEMLRQLEAGEPLDLHSGRPIAAQIRNAEQLTQVIQDELEMARGQGDIKELNRLEDELIAANTLLNNIRQGYSHADEPRQQ